MNSTILIAESDPSIRKLMSDLLGAGGYRVETAGSVAVAAASMAHVQPDAIFVDYHLEGGGGEELKREVDQLGLDVPIALIVDVGMEAPFDLVTRMGVASYIERPIDRNRLVMLARLGVAMKRRQCREKNRIRELSLVKGFLSALMGTGDAAMFLLDVGGNIIEANESAAGLLQTSFGDLVGKEYISLLTPLSAGVQDEAIAKARETLTVQRIEEHRGGAVYNTIIRPVIEDKILSGVVVVTRDITAQRRSEVGLAESEKRYRSVYEAARDAIVMFDRNDGSICDCNAAARRLYGYTSEEMLHMTVAGLSVEPKRALDRLRSGVERIPLAHHRRKGGGSFPVEISMSHFVHDGREVSTAFIQDISHRKVVEEALREGARLYRAVVEDQTELICRYMPGGELTFVNSAYAKFFGVDEDEVIGKKFFPYMASNERRNLKSWLGLAGVDNPVFDREQSVRRHDGEERYVLWTNRAILDHRGEVLEIQAVGRDVTDRKDAERALSLATQEKEQYRLNLEATFRSIPDAIVTVDSEFRVITTNSAAGVMLGLDRGEAVGQPLDDLFGTEGNPCVGVLRQVLRTSKAVRGFEAELEALELGPRMVELNCSPLIDKEKRHTGAVLVVRDISRIADLEKRLHERHGFRGIVGRSSVMQEVYRLLEQLSSLDSTVLILGESGTGKELVADALHYGGSRAGQPLVKVNCSALSESLLESELFGHVRGAFTGAVRDKVGRIQAAQGGSLFLDEIGDISPLIQLKLLRFLEQKEYERVGESRTCSADVRIIAATNVDLREAVRKGAFREDLYYRLNVMPVSLPPLRDRQADIPLLTEHFLDIFSNQFDKSFSRVADEVMDVFMGYSWPGNIRELRHILEHACILSPGKEIMLRHMRKDLVDQMRASVFVEPSPVVEYAPSPLPARKAGKQDILDALERCGGNKARAARQLGIHRATLYRKLKAWGLDD